MLCFIDFSIVLCNCANVRVRYDVTCWYSNRFTYIRIHARYIVSTSRIRTITQFNAEVNEAQHSYGEGQQITQKIIIQLTNCKLIIVQVS